jgi:hydrogenase-4 component F
LAASALPVSGWGGLLLLDGLGLYFLFIVAGVHLVCAVYAYGYFRREMEGMHICLARVRMYHLWINLFVMAMVLVVASHHLAVQWIAVEATTLFSAPLICLSGDRKGLEAAWKYLLICSVGIAFSFLGIIFLSRAAAGTGLTYTALRDSAAVLDPRFVRLAFLFFLVGYGTKMGLAPMHTWLPDAHSQAPAPASALLSGVLLNCALLAILRLVPAVPGTYAKTLLVAFGTATIAVPALLVVVQRDLKRLLAYSSIEHMGIIALGIGFGGAAGPAALLHVLNHSLAKVLLFLLAGTIILAFGTQKIRRIRGLLATSPLTGVLFFGGILAVAGSPPFGAFWSELGIIKGGIDNGHLPVALLCLGLLAALFGTFLLYGSEMVFGEGQRVRLRRTDLWCLVPAGLLLFCSLWLGLHVPQDLYHALERLSAAAAFS